METKSSSVGNRVGFFVYGAATYVLFLAVFLYMVGFAANRVVPKSIDSISGAAEPVGWAILVNVLLLSLFAIQHTIMARPGFKQWWTRFVPSPIERSTFVLVTNAVLVLIFWQWRAMPEVVWSVESHVGSLMLHALCALGWLLALYSTFCIDHFELFGLRQVYLNLRGRTPRHPGFATPWLYRMVRNPLMLGFMIAFWATPTMTQGHLLFALVNTAYIVIIGIRFEERDLLKMLGEEYRRYRERTPMLFPWPRPRRADDPAQRGVLPEPQAVLKSSGH
ncbi:MAG: isoprenylcysteine carboxylmethyltransferase family protein [Phycisphaerales bacterium]|nr:isoprenylcysteine carboxylmethyltransferase family protein [Phycisphaerales bacterium]